jgi:hypothetical protein
MSGTTIQRAAAKELSPDEAEVRAERCFELEKEIKAGLQAGREALWRVARAAHEFDEENGWTALGYENVTEWLADPEVGMTRSTYFRMVGAYRELVVKKQLPMETVAELDVSKVDVVLPRVKGGTVSLKTAIEDMKTLGWRDLRTKYLGRKDATPSAGTDDDESAAAPPPLNPTDDKPVWAGDGPQEAADDVVEGDVIDADVVDEPEPPAQPAHNGHHAHSGQLQPFVVKAREALAMPLRQGPQRRLNLEAVKQQRAALEALLEALEA